MNVGVDEVRIRDSDDDDDDDINDCVFVNVGKVDDSEEDIDSELGVGPATTVAVETREVDAVVIWVTVLASGVEDVDTPVSVDDADVLDAGVPDVSAAAAVKKKTTMSALLFSTSRLDST